MILWSVTPMPSAHTAAYILAADRAQGLQHCRMLASVLCPPKTAWTDRLEPVRQGNTVTCSHQRLMEFTAWCPLRYCVYVHHRRWASPVLRWCSNQPSCARTTQTCSVSLYFEVVENMSLHMQLVQTSLLQAGFALLTLRVGCLESWSSSTNRPEWMTDEDKAIPLSFTRWPWGFGSTRLCGILTTPADYFLVLSMSF